MRKASFHEIKRELGLFVIDKRPFFCRRFDIQRCNGLKRFVRTSNLGILQEKWTECLTYKSNLLKKISI